MDELMLGRVCHGLSGFGLGALFLSSRHGHLPALVAASLDDQQISVVGGLLAEPHGRRQIEQAVAVERDLRAYGRMH